MTSKLIDNNDLKVFNKLDLLYSQVNTLSPSSKQLSEGSKMLLNKISTLKNGVSQSVTGKTKCNNIITCPIGRRNKNIV